MINPANPVILSICCGSMMDHDVAAAQLGGRIRTLGRVELVVINQSGTVARDSHSELVLTTAR